MSYPPTQEEFYLSVIMRAMKEISIWHTVLEMAGEDQSIKRSAVDQIEFNTKQIIEFTEKLSKYRQDKEVEKVAKEFTKDLKIIDWRIVVIGVLALLTIFLFALNRHYI